MNIKRELTSGFREVIDAQESADFPIIFLEIKHSQLIKPIRIVQNSVDIKLRVADVNADAYQGFYFDITILSDTDRPPSAQLKVQNVERKIGAILLDLVNPPVIDMWIYSSARFNETVIPHVPFDLIPAYEFQALNLYLVDVSIAGDFVTGTLKTWEYTQEVYPAVMATEDRFPGLFW